MEHEVKIVIGANFGDEGKGLMSHYFGLKALEEGKSPITVFHNGTAQRGHTVDYNPESRHVFHHFGCNTKEGVPTYFADSFLIHPMEFHREFKELGLTAGNCYCNPNCVVITQYDMLIDNMIEDWIAYQYGEREHGSCGYGSWSTTDRIEQRPEIAYTILDFWGKDKYYNMMMNDQWHWVIQRAAQFGIDIDALPKYKEYFEPNSIRRKNLEANFYQDLWFFITHAPMCSMQNIWNNYDYLIFENGQGLGLDKDVDNEWHTTSSTGLTNPYRLIANYQDFNAEVCYTTRSYLTRHGLGPMESEVEKRHINNDMIDKTNVPNEFQGSLRYGYYDDVEQKQRIAKDWSIVENDKRFTQVIATTHCNEFQEVRNYSKYYSDSPFIVKERD